MAEEWTISTLKEYFETLRKADERFQSERDRRYCEVAHEREKALKIDEQGKKEAMQLAREIQTYKDEKANELREQINNERGLYATKGDLHTLSEKFDLAMKPVTAYVASQQGRSSGLNSGWAYLIGVVTLIGAIISIAFLLKGN